jgi:F0F1-type ATP synthase epsilon subunit
MMNRRALFQITRRVCAARFMSAEAAIAPASSVKLNFSLPHEKIYDEVYVHSVIIPGAAGEYGVTANHVQYVAQLKPGVFQIFREENTTEPEKYFVAGGYALTHEDSSTVRTVFS